MAKQYKIRQFKHTTKEIEDINQALILRKFPDQDRIDFCHNLPKKGWGIYTKSGTFIGGVFLRMIECKTKMAMLDSFVSSPEIPSTLRNEALDALIEHTINKAKSLNIKAILALTVHEMTLLRSDKFRFQRRPHALLSLPLE